MGKTWKIVVGVLIAQAAGLIGSFFTTPNMGGWYAELSMSALTPPGWVFGVVWPTLFLLMGIAAGIVWASKHPQKPKALIFFGAQLALNILWSGIFFGMHAPGLALLEIVFLWLAIFATMQLFFKISRLAGWLLVPYLAWVSFAIYLNYVIWTLN